MCSKRVDNAQPEARGSNDSRVSGLSEGRELFVPRTRVCEANSQGGEWPQIRFAAHPSSPNQRKRALIGGRPSLPGRSGQDSNPQSNHSRCSLRATVFSEGEPETYAARTRTQVVPEGDACAAANSQATGSSMIHDRSMTSPLRLHELVLLQLQLRNPKKSGAPRWDAAS